MMRKADASSPNVSLKVVNYLYAILKEDEKK